MSSSFSSSPLPLLRIVVLLLLFLLLLLLLSPVTVESVRSIRLECFSGGHRSHTNQQQDHEGPPYNNKDLHHVPRSLPSKVIVGYSSHCYTNDDHEDGHDDGTANDDDDVVKGGRPRRLVGDDDKVLTAVHQGVNVVIWAFYPHVDVACIQRTIQRLNQQGLGDTTVHLTSVGGWNGPHWRTYKDGNRTATEEAEAATALRNTSSAKDYYDQWKQTVGTLVHGLDIDFEGNDDMSSRWNVMSTQELDTVGEFITLAKADGYIVTMAPPQSYFDIHTSEFSHYLNLTDTTNTSNGRRRRQWHSDFSYFGRNLYAYWMARYGDAIDLVMVQFYESYSKAAMAMAVGNVTPENYLQQYVWDLNQTPEGPGWWVDFGNDEDGNGGTGTPEFVSVPVSKLVWGLCNAWCRRSSGDDGGEGRHYYFSPEILNAAYQNLWDWMLEPRGFMFWDIPSEGIDGIYYARGLNSILHVRGGNDISYPF